MPAESPRPVHSNFMPISTIGGSARIWRLRWPGLGCATGQFQTCMAVSLVNQGPVTVLLDSSKLF